MKLGTLAFAVISVIISGTAQVALKYGMSSPSVQQALNMRGVDILRSVAFNEFVWLGMFLYSFGAMIWLGVLAKVDVGQAYPFVSLAFPLTMLFGVVFLGETFSLTRVIGTVLITIGVLMIAKGS